jgi:hypothetical protein
MFPKEVEGFWSTKDGRWHLGLTSRSVELDTPEIWEPEYKFAR